jgi:hypothetical protein
MEFLKKYWFLITFVVTPLGVALVWIVSIDSRTFDSAEQKVKHDNHIKNALTPNEEYQKFVQDTMMKGAITRDKEDAIKARAIRVKERKNSDSIILDYIQKNAEQIYQIKEIIREN